ncbi:aspartate:alanine exchanger family transporter [Corynebacterium anserum]|uniref:Transporter n=1 Tax=Corynebacterium anserum TaxID=2684406 RepID=A0A7G7YQZ4_9CORY|nr:aspartate:alanine exchanger family transporter [Corynebacterium anserum]MBC2681505.1 transporter [Corynebacterium anserum]QNH96914.1 transporter [Corynebacterium anserum]
MLDFLAEQPLITLVVICAVGFALGRIRVFGIALGPAAVLFVALALSTANPDIQMPPLLYQLGLSIFVYTIGLTAGRAFFADLPHRGWRLNAFVAILLVTLVAGSFAITKLIHLDGATAAGTLSGALTSTPGMAAIVQVLENSARDLAANPVVGYSLAYPGGILGAIAVAAIGAKVLKVNHVQDALDEGILHAPLEHRSVLLRDGIGGTIDGLRRFSGADIMVSRIIHPDPDTIRLLTNSDELVPLATDDLDEELAHDEAEAHGGAILVIAGTPQELDKAIALLGVEVPLEITKSDISYRRMTISNPAVAGRTIKDIDPLSHGFLITRLRRGDEDVVPHDHDVLQFSDRVRAVAPAHRMKDVERFLGDSERSLADVDLFPFSLGLALGLLLGAVPIPLPGGTHMSLGFGGGPIVIGLVLGALTRTGKIQWQMPYHANRSLGGLGLALFLAGVGTTAGQGFRNALTDPSSLTYIAVGFLFTVTSALVCGVVGTVFMRLRWDEAMGVAAGVSTNPAFLGYLNGQTGTELAARGYTTVYPTAMIGKILGCQILILLLL